ncbi:MAG: MarR family transcriptional regulator [Chloroflexota bacterium]
MATVQLPPDYHEQTPEANILATEALMNMVRTADMALDRIGRLLRPLGVSAAGGLVLGQLRDHGAMSPSELGDRLIVTRATVTGLLDSLERRGLVARTPSPTDRRSIVVGITPDGLEAAQQVRALVHAAETAWLAGLTDDELRTLIALNHRAQDGIEAWADPHGA